MYRTFNIQCFVYSLQQPYNLSTTVVHIFQRENQAWGNLSGLVDSVWAEMRGVAFGWQITVFMVSFLYSVEHKD